MQNDYFSPSQFLVPFTRSSQLETFNPLIDFQRPDKSARTKGEHHFSLSSVATVTMKDEVQVQRKELTFSSELRLAVVVAGSADPL